MGFPYNELIPPAILLDNPGITKEEFVRLLDKTHSFSFCEFEKEDPWNCSAHIEYEDKKYHQGLEGLACILNLEYSEQYKKFHKNSVDEYGLNIRPPFFRPINEKEQDGPGYKFKVIHHVKNVLDEPKRVKEL